ncbi:hypothetical protein [Micromonospora cathayae]|uniref:ATP synthase protein I n=1 Tax=Micromonospora cathayae TaxID=3028804 RepID=A0ABY7ZQ45_9ACTN|nr:hypothetical protein [Micromonospora sp. HUAS 3]WDZ85020.1 hypothetical protein PVK37_00630 [Micromonospora sp. HUAS 3]
MAETGTDTPEATTARTGNWRLRHLPVLLAATAVSALAAAGVGALLDGPTAALGAALGVAVTALSYTLTTVVLAWADSVNPQLVLPFGLGLYAAKFTLLGGVMMAVAASGWAGLLPLCVGIAVGVVVWTGVHIWWLTVVHARRAD